MSTKNIWIKLGINLFMSNRYKHIFNLIIIKKS